MHFHFSTRVLLRALRRAALVAAIAGLVPLIAGSGVSFADGGKHLLLVPRTADATNALRNAGAKVLAGYEDFTLVEADAKRIDALLKAGATMRDDMRFVRIGQHNLDPTLANDYFRHKIGRTPQIADRGGSGMVVVQYIGPLKSEWTDAVSAVGLEAVTYMGENAQLVIGPSGALAALNDLAAKGNFIRAIVPYDVSAKLRPGLQRSGAIKVTVSTAAGKTGDAARNTIAGLSTSNGEPVKVAGFVNQRVTMNADNLDYVAGLGAVVAIEPWIEPKLHDERAATIVAGKVDNMFQPVIGLGYRHYLLAAGFPALSPVVIDITDEGVDKGVVPVPAGAHPDFYRFGVASNPSRLVYAQEATAADTDARDCGGHGTNVASIASGYNNSTGATYQDAQGYHYALGIQPFGLIGATKIFNCATGTFDVQTSITALHSAAYNNGARISNNSWGAAVGGAYNAQAQEFDALVRDAMPAVAGNQQFVEVVSAGNSGSGANSIGSPGTAKNVITVGASENVRPIGGDDGCGVPDSGANSARDIIYFSSRGPTDDGRIKPDVVAPGTHVSGAQPQTGGEYNGSGTCDAQFPAGSTLYNLVSGTSQAAPEVTGFSSLVFTWFKNIYTGSVSGHAANGYPSPAMTKALMINTATDLVGGDAGNMTLNANVPTNIQGWGRINLSNLLGNTMRDLVDQSLLLTASGTSKSRYYTIASAAKPVKVSLVWTDPPGPTTGKSLVNDLDLEVTANGKVYKGNVFANGNSITGGSTDTVNNVENVFLPPGIGGSMKVRVIGTNIAANGVPGNNPAMDQDFALVVSNVNPPTTTPVLVAGAASVVPLGDGDNILEPGDTFKVALKVTNVGNAAATSITGRLTAPNNQALITQKDSAWPNIGPNGSKNNSTYFQGTVRNSVACGDLVNLNVRISANNGTTDVPFSLQTGRVGPDQVFTATDVPKSIPDDDTTGVNSVLAMPGVGIINNVTVTIGNLTHTFVSDLQIDLKSPQGTTVRLFDRRGGSGDNMVNTVFTDSSATPISSGTAPFTGSFVPDNPLSVFKGEHSNGNWTLTVRDLAQIDTGTLNSWSMTRSRVVCN